MGRLASCRCKSSQGHAVLSCFYVKKLHVCDTHLLETLNPHKFCCIYEINQANKKLSLALHRLENGHHYVGSLADSFSSLYFIQLISVKNILNHSTRIIDECVLLLRAPSVGVCSSATNECLVEAHFTLAVSFSELQSTVSASALLQ